MIRETVTKKKLDLEFLIGVYAPATSHANKRSCGAYPYSYMYMYVHIHTCTYNFIVGKCIYVGAHVPKYIRTYMTIIATVCT